MSSTYLDLNYHIVFSTRNRRPLIRTSWRSDLHRYMGGIVKGLGGVPIKINGIHDHVHLLIGLRATHCLSDFVRELKKASSSWVKQHQSTGNFAWQKGYAAFTVSASAKGSVSVYISRQEEHHRGISFREELIDFLNRAGIEYDPRYLD